MNRSLKKLGLIQPLAYAESYLLQILTSRFGLTRLKQTGGVKLEVEFDRETDAIWNWRAKEKIRESMRNFNYRWRKEDRKIAAFISGKKHDYKPDKSFLFRYVSGGTLPVLKVGRRRYYCFFYREVYPIGWNIANGGADTFHELLNPMDAVKRELGEELLIVDPKRQKRYVFEWDVGEIVDWPGFRVVRKVFHKEYPDLNLAACDEFLVKPKWTDGPDAVRVTCKGEETRLVTGCFVNVNAEDFGIEVDRVANIKVDKGVVIFDGEISSNMSIGSPIGLFPVEEVNASVRGKAKKFLPESFFYDAKSCDDVPGGLINTIRDVYIPRLREKGIISKADEEFWRKTYAKGLAFNLCPVTRSIIERYIEQEGKHVAKRRHFDLFLSWARPDKKYAYAVYDYLTKHKKLEVFCAGKTPMWTDFSNEIHNAIRDSDGMIIIATQPSHMKREGVILEWSAFLTMIRQGSKPKTSPLLNFVSGFGYDELPNLISGYQIINFEPGKIKLGLKELKRFIDNLPKRWFSRSK